MNQIRREVTLAPGPVVVRNMSSRNKKKFADYVLSWEPGVSVAIVEAKDNCHAVSHGIQQALGYAKIPRFALRRARAACRQLHRTETGGRATGQRRRPTAQSPDNPHTPSFHKTN